MLYVTELSVFFISVNICRIHIYKIVMVHIWKVIVIHYVCTFCDFYWQLSQFPHYNVDASWEVQRSDHYFESICRLAVGNIIWQSQQLYHYQSTEDSIDFAVLCTLTCPSLGVDYGVDVQYQVLKGA